MVNIAQYIKRFNEVFSFYSKSPWEAPENIEIMLIEKIKSLSPDYKVTGDTAIHKSARIEEHVIMKGAMIIGPGCFIGAHAYLRGGIFLDERAVVGPGCEVKTSFLFAGSALAHFNFVGDSIVGSSVNMEAGSIIANYHNDREDKAIHVLYGGEKIKLPVIKFGAVVGDGTKIGANAVLSPGTILEQGSVVGRLELVRQLGDQ
ncbi:MAG: DapH/DapD/GlmU-related protein [Chryseolinea sp.]